MVVISVSLCGKQGKVLFARQYASMSKLRVEHLLSSFLQIIKQTSNQEQQHRFIDMDDIRYIYKAYDSIYLLIITNKQSNVLNDLHALTVISKLVSKHCKNMDDIHNNAFDLLYALDEVINPMGEIEPINMKQIAEFVEMDSAEEKLSQIIQTSKVEAYACGGHVMKRKSAVFDKRKDMCMRTKPATIGLCVGGAKDVTNFRDCMHKNIIPTLQSITYNGLLNEYHFDITTTAARREEQYHNMSDDGSMLFYPSYCYAKVNKLQLFDDNDCIQHESDEYEYYLSVGLNSNIKQEHFKRKQLNLVIVLDVSGSMNSSFNCGYGSRKAKISIATRAIVGLFKHLNAFDRVGIVTFESVAQCIQSLEYIKDINMNKLKKTVLNIESSGGTNFESGYNAAIRLYLGMLQQTGALSMDDAYENRVLFLTDAQPNVGITNADLLMNMVSKYAEMGIDDNIHSRIYTTFIGVGLDFNADLVNTISNTRGCNYYSVNNDKAFLEIMDQEFEYMVTPLVFNVCLRLNCEGNVCSIDKVYGSTDEMNIIKNGEIARIHTLFPSKKCIESGETKGGIQLIKLKKNAQVNSDKMNVEIQVTFEDRKGKKYENKQLVTFESVHPMEYNDMIQDTEHKNSGYYDNTGIRKAILLCNYTDVLKNWIHSTKMLQNNEHYKQIFTTFCKYFKDEMSECQDSTLQKELDIIQKVIFNIHSFKRGHICAHSYAYNNVNYNKGDVSPVEIKILEKLFVEFDHDGCMKTFEVKGDLQVAVNDPLCAQCVVETNVNPSRKSSLGKVVYRLHPRMDNNLWKTGILCLKDSQKKWRIGRASQTSILKWRIRSCDDSNIPISIEYWIDKESNDKITVSVAYECNIAMKNVVIIFPLYTNQEPKEQIYDHGDVSFYRNEGELQWVLNNLENGDVGELEYVVSDVQLVDLYPVSVHFEIESIYSDITIINVRGVQHRKQYEHSINSLCVAEKYIVDQ